VFLFRSILEVGDGGYEVLVVYIYSASLEWRWVDRQGRMSIVELVAC
jgi:hypothetical protein